MPKLHSVVLSPDARAELEALLAGGTAPTRKLTHARILLKVDEGPDGPAWTDTRTAEALEISRATVERVRARWASDGQESALSHRPPARTRPRRLDGRQEAQLVTLVCGAPPAGRDRWTLRLLADRMVELQVVESVSYQTIRRTLKKTSSSPGARSAGAFPIAVGASSWPQWKTSSASMNGARIPGGP